MRTTDVVIIGGGQAGLAMSCCLTARGIDHVVLERGRVAERWRSERWDSLRLLTPNWQSRLPGFRYDGDDPDGYMTMPELIAYLERYAAWCGAPVEAGAGVTRVEACGHGIPHPDNPWGLAVARGGRRFWRMRQAIRPGTRRGAAARHRSGHADGISKPRAAARGGSAGR